MQRLLHKTFPVIVALVLWFSGRAVAYTNGWSGWPCPTNADWNGACADNHYFFQLYTSLVERCVAVNQTFAPIVDTGVTLYNGYTNNVVTTNGMTVTNPVVQYKTVSLTNQFLPFTYTYSNSVVSGISTYNPPMRRSWFTNWDNVLFSLCTPYVNTGSLGTDGTFNAYFLSVTSQTWSAVPPTYSATSLFAAAGIGWTNRSVAHWTQSAVVSNSDWLLASLHSSGMNNSQWTFKRWSDLSTMHPYSALFKPLAQYVAGGTNGITNLQFTMSGNAWGDTGTNIINVSETVSFSSASDVALANAWRSITNITCNSTRPNSNDAVRIAYRTLPPLYDSAIGWRLTPESLNERKRCVDAMSMTYRQAAGVTTLSGTRRNGDSAAWTNDWTGAKATAESRFAVTNTGIFPKLAVGTDGDWNIVLGVYARISNPGPFLCNPYPVSTNFSYHADLYVRSTPPLLASGLLSDEYYDAWGSDLRKHQYAKVSSSSTEISGVWSTSFGTPAIGTDKPIPPWCPEPSATNRFTGYGFYIPLTNNWYGESYSPITPPIVIFRWTDSANGFKYK